MNITQFPNAVDDASTENVLRPMSCLRTPAPTACLVQLYPTDIGIGTLHPMTADHLSLGRDPGCDIVIDDHAVSRLHARVGARGDRYYLLDLQSTNGSFVNDEPTLIRILEDGDYVRLGSHIFRFLCGGNVEVSYYEELRRVAVIDALTGISNRRHLLEFLEREIGRAARYARPLSVLLADVDHFKAINDNHGHLAGDETLRELAGRLRDCIRHVDLLARYGGEEFAVVLTESTPEGALESAERLRRLVADTPFRYRGAEFSVTISIGVASLDRGETLGAQNLLQKADDQLYRAKHAGRNRVMG
jgi:diguanylate cyclase (GGDEF)-like protein